MINKKRVLLVFLITLTLLPISSAIELGIEKDVYHPKETLNAQILGNFVEFDIDNIKIYENGIPREEPVINGITKQNYVYHYYAILPRKEGNFTLKLVDVKVLENDRVETKSFARNFTIVNPNTSSLSISPGFILLDSDTFKITIKSLYGNNDVKITLPTGQSMDLFLVEGDDKIVELVIDDLQEIDNTNLTVLKVNDYLVPMFIKSGLINTTNKDNQSVIEDGDKILAITPNELISYGNPNDVINFTILLKNIGNKTIDSIRASSNIVIDINPSEIKGLRKDKEKTIELSLLINPGNTEDIIGELMLVTDDKEISIPIFIDLNSPVNQTNGSVNNSDIGYRCVDLGGTLCEFDETCETNTTSSIDGPCCLGNCIIEKESSSYNYIIGIVLIILLVLIIGFAYLKARKKSKPKSTNDVLKERKDRFRKRLNPKKPTEVNKSLSRD